MRTASVDLAAIAGRRPPLLASAEETLEQTSAHWRGTLASAGLDFDTPRPASAVLPAIVAELERLVCGLTVVREGGSPRNLPPKPSAGMDAVSAMECAAMLRELCAVAERGRARSQGEWLNPG
ncbi:hypothetical protein ABZ478_32850 [Streptomyces sp. NPDC005706]|uniref:hypothetical protein n=1 Tax=Streptomyces sp. NPDC005706 TaxID=3157169 RepID=UPI0033FCA950